MLTSLKALTFLSYGINFKDSGGSVKTLRAKLDIWLNTKDISVPYPNLIIYISFRIILFIIDFI